MSMPKKSDAGGKSDKEWGEWTRQRAGELSTHNFSNQHPQIAHEWLLKMLTEYDKLKSDKWEKLREFVKRHLQIAEWNNEPRTITMMQIILAEISRLEKEEP